MRRLLPLLASGLCAASTVLAPMVMASMVMASIVLAPAAHAERLVTEDARGDVVGLEARDGAPAPVPAPPSASGDIARTVVAHDPDELRVKVWFGPELVGRHRTTFDVRTPDATYSVSLVHVHTGRSVHVRFSSLVRGSEVVPCDRYSALNAHRVVVGLPTACLGSPAWVRVGVLDQQGSRSRLGVPVQLVDDAHRHGATSAARIRLGRRVHPD